MASAPDPAPPGPDALLEVVRRHLGEEAGPVPRRGLPLGRIFARRRPLPTVEPDLQELLALVADDPAPFAELTAALSELLADPDTHHELLREALPDVFQSYVRAVGRIAAAEGALARRLVRDTPPAERPAALERAITKLLPLAQTSFGTLHRLLLREALVEELVGLDAPAARVETLVVAMVDVVGSTEFLAGATPAELERLVDALFAAGQSATAHRPVHVVKYVGDGVFLAGRDARAAADAALEILTQLERDLPLRARAGMARGEVVERAGDVFGLAINLAHHVTKAARPGTLLATERAAQDLPTERRGRWRTVTSGHPAVAATRVATIKPAG